ncbi:MAG: PIG-L family deacetylase [Acidimicrobiales bacterium]
MTFLPTIVCVHAHPDDEAFFGGGASAHYAALGHRLVLITCTSGQLGYDSSGRAGNVVGHDALDTKANRAGELQRSAAMLGFSRIVTLGFDDSGMKGWPENDNPNAFMNASVDAVARTVASIMDEEDARVVITYDESGFYGHPDHIQANVVAQRAVELATSVQRLYYSVVPEGIMTSLVEQATAQGLLMPAWVLDAGVHVKAELVATTLEVGPYVRLKHDAMAAHATQIDNQDLINMDDALFDLLFGTEYYQRAWARAATDADQTDLIGGLS